MTYPSLFMITDSIELNKSFDSDKISADTILDHTNAQVIFSNTMLCAEQLLTLPYNQVIIIKVESKIITRVGFSKVENLFLT